MDLSPAIVSSTVRQMIWCCNKLILINWYAVKSLIILYRVALIYVYKAIAHFTAKQKVKKKDDGMQILGDRYKTETINEIVKNKSSWLFGHIYNYLIVASKVANNRLLTGMQQVILITSMISHFLLQ